jgi:heme oxygenase
MSLRDAIKVNHDKAEQHPFVKLLLSGKVPRGLYANYLFNQAICYSKLEDLAKDFGLLEGIEEVCRSALITKDAEELSEEPHSLTLHPSTHDYLDYLDTVSAKDLWAHIYVRHFADMYGGQLIKTVAPGSCRMYEFSNKQELIGKIRASLSADLADEANRVFTFALRLFDEVQNAYDLQPA